MVTDAQRIANYIAGYVPTTVGLKIASMLSGMKSYFAPAISDLVRVELLIQGILNLNGIQPIQYPFYLDFGRELWKRQWKGIDGASLLLFAKPLRAKYVSWGLELTKLDEIALTVFGLSIPPP